jgi:hypothetical protein
MFYLSSAATIPATGVDSRRPDLVTYNLHSALFRGSLSERLRRVRHSRSPPRARHFHPEMIFDDLFVNPVRPNGELVTRTIAIKICTQRNVSIPKLSPVSCFPIVPKFYPPTLNFLWPWIKLHTKTFFLDIQTRKNMYMEVLVHSKKQNSLVNEHNKCLRLTLFLNLNENKIKKSIK